MRRLCLCEPADYMLLLAEQPLHEPPCRPQLSVQRLAGHAQLIFPARYAVCTHTKRCGYQLELGLPLRSTCRTGPPLGRSFLALRRLPLGCL